MRRALIFILFFSNNIFAATNAVCQNLITNRSEILQELQLENMTICLHRSEYNKEITISIFKRDRDKYKKIAENNSLITPNEIREGQPFIETLSKEKFQIVYSFPRDTYAIELESPDNSVKIVKIYKTIKIDNTLNATPDLISFSIEKEKLEAIDFKSLSYEAAFDKNLLKLSQTSKNKELLITAEKSKLFSAPDASSELDSYLVKGDRIKLLDSWGPWLLIRYENPIKKDTIERWIKISDAL